MSETSRIYHPFGPLYNTDSKVLILGSFPSVKSREQQFFYGHPQNRFWKVIAAVTDNPVPRTIDEKKQLILSSGLALGTRSRAVRSQARQTQAYEALRPTT